MPGVYEWMKALHVLAVMIWMAGMMVLPFLFMSHCDAPVGSEKSALLKTIEHFLLKRIINPAMIVAWLAGPYLAWSGHWWTSGWFHAKLAVVVALSGVHGLFARWVKDFAADRERNMRLTYSIASTLPITALTAIVILVIVRPF